MQEFQYAHQPAAPPLNAASKDDLGHGYHGVFIVSLIGVLAFLCIAATLLSASGRAWCGLTSCHSSMPMEENVLARATALLQLQDSSSSAIQDSRDLQKMPIAEVWQFVMDGEGRAGAVDTQRGNLQGVTVATSWPAAGGKASAAAAAAGEGGLSTPLLPGSATSQKVNNWTSLQVCHEYLSCWDMAGNFRTMLMKKDGGVPEMRVLNGLRVLSMGWVVLGHTYLYMQMVRVATANSLPSCFLHSTQYTRFGCGPYFVHIQWKLSVVGVANSCQKRASGWSLESGVHTNSRSPTSLDGHL